MLATAIAVPTFAPEAAADVVVQEVKRASRRRSRSADDTRMILASSRSSRVEDDVLIELVLQLFKASERARAGSCLLNLPTFIPDGNLKLIPASVIAGANDAAIVEAIALHHAAHSTTAHRLAAW